MPADEKYETLMVENGYKAYMKLRIRNISRDDFAEYKCEARNSLGASDGSISLYGEGGEEGEREREIEGERVDRKQDKRWREEEEEEV